MSEKRRYISEFGTAGDGKTNDREAVRTALATCAAAGDILVVDKPLYIEIEDEQLKQPIRLQSNTLVEFEGGGKMIVNHDRLPVFWSLGADNISFSDAHFEYKGRHSSKFNQATAMAFQKLADRNLFWTGPTAYSAVFHLRGGEKFRFKSPKFIADTTDPSELFCICFYFGPGMDKVYISDIRITDPLFDGCYCPIHTQHFHGLYMSNIHSIRYGVLPSTLTGKAGGDGDWFPPPHIFYNSAPSEELVIDGVLDEGKYVGGGNWGQSSLKPTRVSRFTIRNVKSYRDHGVLDFNGDNGHIENITWVGDASVSNSGKMATLPIRWLNGDGKVQHNVHWANIHLKDTSKDYKGPIFKITNYEPDRPTNCTIRNFNIEQESWKNCGIIQEYMAYCELEINWVIRDASSTDGRILLFSAKDAAGPNKFAACLRGFPNSNFRVIATTGSTVTVYNEDKGRQEDIRIEAPRKAI